MTVVKPDVKLGNGRELTFNLMKININEYRSLFDPAQSPQAGDEVIAKTCDISAAEIGKLPQPEYKKLLEAFFTKARSPTENPT